MEIIDPEPERGHKVVTWIDDVDYNDDTDDDEDDEDDDDNDDYF